MKICNQLCLRNSFNKTRERRGTGARSFWPNLLNDPFAAPQLPKGKTVQRTMNRPPINPYLVLLIGVISVSTSAILVKLSSAPAPITAMYRLVFSVLLMLPFVMGNVRKEITTITRRDFTYSAIAGVFLAFHFILWFESLEYTSVASSVVLVTLQPIFAFIGTFLFYKERFTTAALITSAMAIAGSIVISWGDFRIDGMALFGDFLALMGAVMVTGYFLFGQTVRRNTSLLAYTFVVYGISSITLILYNLMLRNPFFTYPTSDWIMFLLLAIVPTLLGHSLFNWALKWLSTSVISMSILFEPIGASILAWLILDESIKATQWIGGLLVISGLLLFYYMEKMKQRQIAQNTSETFDRLAD